MVYEFFVLLVEAQKHLLIRNGKIIGGLMITKENGRAISDPASILGDLLF
jgi:hypothetical protein